MPKREPDLLLKDIRAAVARIERYTSAIDREQFLSDEKTIDAVARSLEIIGEAARLLPNEFKSKHPNIPRAQIAGLRNRIVHDYFGLDLEIICTAHLSPTLDCRTACRPRMQTRSAPISSHS